jgi:diguanylate cyclase (GGDEF)-like protein
MHGGEEGTDVDDGERCAVDVSLAPASVPDGGPGSAPVRAAAEALMDRCVDVGYELPSLYLEQGERLRCIAQRGYWHVYDGLPPGAGVLGSTYQSGRLQVVQDAATHAHYIPAIPQVAAEICAPLTFRGRTIGVLNVESRSPFTERDVENVRRMAETFSERLEELGGPPLESSAQRLARLIYELACVEDARRLTEMALEGAMHLTGLSGAALLRDDDDGRRALLSYVIRGPLGGLVDDAGPAVAAQLADYVAEATSSYACGVGDGEGFEAVHALRDRGVASLVVLALLTKGRRSGVVVLLGDRPAPELAALIPLLEMLAATLASMLDAAGTSAALVRSQRELAHQAMHDPLTGLANRGRLLSVLREELAAPRESGAPIALFVDLDGFKAVNDQHGHRIGDELLVAVADRLRTAARDTDLVARIGGDEFVVLCPHLATMEEAETVAARILQRLSAPFSVLGTRTDISGCIGIASGAGVTNAEDLIAAADRAMYQAKRTGTATWAVAST